jgi:(1->4)-alpha-D-glucan 1-alpha-D-glucosylmutase
MDTQPLLQLALDRIAERRRLPESTYRLQFHAGFTFRDAAAAIGYLADLGVTHAYASPYLKARPGSTHGYDVIDHNQLNPELGTSGDHAAYSAALADRGMGQVLDTVPNHVGVGTNDNAWWNDVLENGRASKYADCFDISWDGAPKPEDHGKVLLPTLGGELAEVLAKGELKLTFDLAAGTFSANYYDRRLPIDPRTYGLILNSRVDDLTRGLGEGHDELREYRAVAAAADALPETPASGNSVAAAARAEQVATVKRRLADLVRRNSTAREFIERAVARLNGTPGDAASHKELGELLDRQHYRLAFWRLAPDAINYRRFFDINDLAALAMERPGVFEAAHALTLKLVADGVLDGLRIDHPDGLYDPKGYLLRLQRHAIVAHAKAAYDGDEKLRGQPWADVEAALVAKLATSDVPTVGYGPNTWPLPVWVEKILAPDEPLPAGWATHGTSGYDALNMISGLYVDPAGETPLTTFYAEAVPGSPADLHDLVYEKKKLILRISLASELRMLADRLLPIAEAHPAGKAFGLPALADALRELIACFPVYRSYVDEQGVPPADVPLIEGAITAAVRRNPRTAPAVFHFVRDVLLQRYPAAATADDKSAWLRFAGKFQQLTAPATAKGIEDTAFYIYNRLISLNEVGGEPAKFGVSPGELHAYLADRQAHWPHAISALSTHDTKRSEDVRARLHVLSEIPGEWRERVTAWSKLNAANRTQRPGGKSSPDANEEYLLYQTLVGVYPLDPADAAKDKVVDRVQAYMLKAMREAKVNTSWTDSNADHEKAVERFVAAVLDEKANAAFFADFLPFHQRVARVGMVNALSQTLLRLTAPGVPDTYQGTELWDLSLVDPDNRRPVDYDLRRRLLFDLRRRTERDDLGDLVADLLRQPACGRVKLYTTWRTLTTRRALPGLFSAGAYQPLSADGERADRLFGFARSLGSAAALVVVPRLTASLTATKEGWPLGSAAFGDTTLRLPPAVAGKRLFNVFTGEELTAAASAASGEKRVAAGTALAKFPIGLWITDDT